MFPLVKCQKHERVSISPISPKDEVPKTMRGSLFPLFPLFSGPIFSSCQDMDHQNRGNRGNRDPLMVLALRLGEIETLSVFSLDEVPKP